MEASGRPPDEPAPMLMSSPAGRMPTRAGAASDSASLACAEPEAFESVCSICELGLGCSPLCNRKDCCPFVDRPSVAAARSSGYVQRYGTHTPEPCLCYHFCTPVFAAEKQTRHFIANSPEMRDCPWGESRGLSLMEPGAARTRTTRPANGVRNNQTACRRRSHPEAVQRRW